MTDLLSHLVDAPLPNILILAGLAFLGIGIVGKINGKIEPSTAGRVMSGLLGLTLMIFGLYSHMEVDAARDRDTHTDKNGITEKQRGQKPENPTSDRIQTGTPAGENQPFPAPESGSKSLLFGDWKNDNPQTRGVTRLRVHQDDDQIVVHAWSACPVRDCDWGIARCSVNEHLVSVTWDQPSIKRKMLLVPDKGRLRMELDNVSKDKPSPRHEVEYFVRPQ